MQGDSMKRGLILTALAVALFAIGLVACSSGEDEPEADMRVVLQQSDNCSGITQWRIIADKPFNRTFSGEFTDGTAQVEWVYMPPEAEFELDLQLMAGATTYSYRPTIAKPWGSVATFSIDCDEGIDKPAVTLDLNPVNAVVTTPQTCNWFSEVRVLEEYMVNADTGQPMLRRLFADTLDGRRTVFFWHDPEFVDPILVVEMVIPERGADGGDLLHDFRFPLQTEWGERFDFTIGCGEGVNDVSMTLQVNGQSYEPTPFGEDGDEDGDVDGDAPDGDTPDGDMVDGDADGDVVDGDADGDVVDGDADGDVVDGDADGDVIDGDADGDVVDGDVDAGCGSTDPDVYHNLEAEAAFLQGESSPSELAEVVDTTGESSETDGDVELEGELDIDGDSEVEAEPPYENPNISGDGYVRLNATEVGGELVFEINLPETWQYRFLIDYVGGKDTWGKVSLFVDDATEPIALQNGDTVKNLEVATTGVYNEWPLTMTTYEPVCLTAGTHRVRVRVVDTDSNGYTIGVDRISFSSE